MKNYTHNPQARREAIYKELLVSGAMSVNELCELFHASPGTIRRDLTALENKALLRRGYGGATVAIDSPAEQAFAAREQKNVEAKRAIARRAIKLIEPGQTLFLAYGSTTLALAREIAASKRKLFVATSALNFPPVLIENPNVTVCLMGGFVARTLLSTSGYFTESMVDQINADLAIVSPDGFSPEQGLTYEDSTEAAIAKRMIRQARRTMALIIEPKLTRRGRMKAATADEIDVMVTDGISTELKRKFTGCGIEVIVTPKR